MSFRPRSTLTLGLALVLGWGASSASAQHQPEDATVVFLVRHAEKAEGDPRDPGLTGAGAERADLLARILADARLTHVFTSDFRRTRGTAGPAARGRDLRPLTYDPADLPALVARIRANPGRHLVVGHSNTTPEVVRLLGADPGEPIDEATEYDRLYVVVLHPGGGATGTLLRYGAP